MAWRRLPRSFSSPMTSRARWTPAPPLPSPGLRTVLLLDEPATWWDVDRPVHGIPRSVRRAAAVAVERASRELLSQIRPQAWYKKIDSALRGHPGAEIAVTGCGQRRSRILVAPALPSEGRVVRSGQVSSTAAAGSDAPRRGHVHVERRRASRR